MNLQQQYEKLLEERDNVIRHIGGLSRQMREQEQALETVASTIARVGQELCDQKATRQRLDTKELFWEAGR
jgi:hypothetical protein